MAQVPAICDRCGTVFNSGIAADNARGLRIEHSRAGPCPACGAVGHIPDGLYDVVGNVITVLQAPERTVAELQRLREILEHARKRHEPSQATAERVARDLPQLRAVAEEFRRAPIGTTASLGTLILTAILVVQGARDSAPKEHGAVIEQVINNYVNTLPRARVAKPRPSPVTTPIAGAKTAPVHVSPKPGRNEPCSCGSGRKYKKCCGAPPPVR